MPQYQQEELWSLAKQMMSRAYAPYSKYKVGACAVAEDGTMFGGCNVENASYGLTICAETVAICSLVAAGKKQIHALAVIGSGDELCTPCGRCRQMIREFAVPNVPIYLCDRNGIRKTVTLEELLPLSFGPEFLE
jgi:cytidine deaminase